MQPFNAIFKISTNKINNKQKLVVTTYNGCIEELLNAGRALGGCGAVCVS